MTTIVLIHPGEHRPQFRVFAEYDAPAVHHVFARHNLDSRDEAEFVAHGLMETFEADHFRRVIEVGERINRRGD
jgi:hypothetical protein